MMNQVKHEICSRRWHVWLSGVSFLLAYALALPCIGQVNSGSDGSDGAFHPTSNTVIDMADHPDGIYHYTSVEIPADVTVTFIPNANNSPVVWLVQSNCVISGNVNINGQNGTSLAGANGGPGGYRGGNGSLSGSLGGSGLGPGGGQVSTIGKAANASYGTLGDIYSGQSSPGATYGNQYLLPLLGGSGGCGGNKSGAGGGGGAILIAATNITLHGSINASGGTFFGNGAFHATNSGDTSFIGGGGSGGAIRLVATSVSGSGTLSTSGGQGSNWYHYYKQYYYSYWGIAANNAGKGRIRIDALSNLYNGTVNGTLTSGYQPIIIAPPANAMSLAIQSVAGVSTPSNPVGSLTTPDVIIQGNQQNPVPIIVQCINIPLNTEIIIDVTPANGVSVRAIGVNNSGSHASSTATVQMSIPRGGGVIQAKAISGIADMLYGAVNQLENYPSLVATGWTADGERFVGVEVTATLSGVQELTYLTASGRGYKVPVL